MRSRRLRGAAGISNSRGGEVSDWDPSVRIPTLRGLTLEQWIERTAT